MPKDQPESVALADVLSGAAEMRITDPNDASLAITTRILSAETADDVLAGAQTLDADSALNRPFILHDFAALKSSYEEGPGFFAILDATFKDTGERKVVTCGGSNVMAQVVRLKQLDALPKDVMLTKSEKPTSNGFYPLWLTAPPVSV